MADTTDNIFYEKEPEIVPNYVGHATTVYAIHMGVVVVICILIGIFWRMDAMWIIGGFTSFWMTAWHLIAIRKAMDKQL
jgi:hypothetical protein